MYCDQFFRTVHEILAYVSGCAMYSSGADKTKNGYRAISNGLCTKCYCPLVSSVNLQCLFHPIFNQILIHTLAGLPASFPKEWVPISLHTPLLHCGTYRYYHQFHLTNFTSIVIGTSTIAAPLLVSYFQIKVQKWRSMRIVLLTVLPSQLHETETVILRNWL
jgi:hypothetical protein